jgi:hypothetical protein
MIEFISPGIGADRREAIEQQVTRLGLEHRLITQWTSFVAVAREVVNPGGEGVRADVEVPKVAGVSDAAYPPGALPEGAEAPGRGVLVRGVSPAQPAFVGQPMQLAAQGGFVGASGPEPSTWLALSALASMAGALWWRRAGAHSHAGVRWRRS